MKNNSVNWYSIIDRKPPSYNWIILGYWNKDEEEMAWQIGRISPEGKFTFFCDCNGGPYSGDSVFPFNPDQTTHWLEITEYKNDLVE